MRHAAPEAGRMIDFREEWRLAQKLRNATDSADAWSARAKRFDNTDAQSSAGATFTSAPISLMRQSFAK